MTKDNKKDPKKIEKQVTEFLQNHPDFLDSNPELLASLTISHDSGQAVSLLERQVKVLRKQSEDDREQLQNLISVARENDQTNQRIHELLLSLLEIRNTEELLNQLQDDLRDRFDVNAVRLRLFATETMNELEDKHTAIKQLNHFFSTRQPLCGRLTKAQLSFLFGEEASEIRSAALVPLQGKFQTGVLAMGSYDEHRFNPGKGTRILQQLGDILSFRIKDLEIINERHA